MARPVAILLVEDDRAIAATVTYALEREHFVVVSCSTGAEARTRWQGDDYSLAILDVGLPDQSGFELCRQLRAIHPDRAIMFLTAHSDEVDRIVGLELGADDYLCKPFSPRELVLRVKTILRRPGPVVTADHDANPWLQHDPERRKISYRGKALALTRSEYLLLAHLLKYPGRVFSRDFLLDLLGDGHSSDRAIDTHIKEIRAKLRSIDAQSELIITHRGLGYSLADSESGP